MLCFSCAGMAFSGWFLERKLGGNLESLQERQVCTGSYWRLRNISYAASNGALAHTLLLRVPVGGASEGDSHELGASFCEDWPGAYGLFWLAESALLVFAIDHLLSAARLHGLSYLS